MSAYDIVIDDTARTAKMYFAAWGNRDSYGDILLKGCCSKSIAEHGPNSSSPQKIAFLWQHDIKNPIGRIVAIMEDNKGLYCEVAFDPIPDANRAMVQLAAGTINQGSIGFQYIWDKVEYEEKTDSYIVSEIRLYEVSLVTIGANENTPFLGFKARELLTANETLTRELDKALKGLDYDKQIELRQLISKKIALTEQQPVKPTVITEPQKKEVDWMKIMEALSTI